MPDFSHSLDSGTATGGFWSTGFGQFLGGMLGPVASEAMGRELTANENQLSRIHDEYMSRLAQNNALQQMRMQQAFEKEMSSTAYQRAVKDMEAAGLNPAAMAGTNAQAASTPSSSTVGVRASTSSASGYGNSSWGNAMMNSALDAVFAKSRDASKIAGQELIDNARHAHKMEEIAEWKRDASITNAKSGSDWLDKLKKSFD